MATATISNVWEKVNFDFPRKRVLLAEQPDDILRALGCYQPGAPTSRDGISSEIS